MDPLPLMKSLAHILKKVLFDVPQICTLTDKVTLAWKLRDQSSPVAIKILINPLICVESHVFVHQFHCNNLTVSQFCL